MNFLIQEQELQTYQSVISHNYVRQLRMTTKKIFTVKIFIDRFISQLNKTLILSLSCTYLDYIQVFIELYKRAREYAGHILTSIFFIFFSFYIAIDVRIFLFTTAIRFEA